MQTEIRNAMEARGFAYEGTGGGCDAYIRSEMEDGVMVASVWVTAECGPSIPESMDEPVDVGYYAGQYADTLVLMMRFPSLTAFLAVTGIQADVMSYQTQKYGSAE